MKKQTSLVTGDIITLAFITIIGFATHGETDLSFLPRMLTTFIPLLIGWFLVAPWLELFDIKTVTTLRQLWRIPLAMLLAAPLTSILRAVLLNSIALPLFTLILGGSATIGMFVWRSIWVWINLRRSTGQAIRSH